MKIRLIAIGKIKEKYLREGIEEFKKRLRAFQIELEELELPEMQGDSAKCVEQESAKILEKVREDFVVFDIGGRLVSSEDLAKILHAREPKGYLDLVVGGSHGLSAELLSHTKNNISFGKITFPHQLFRLVVCEQIYRAASILHGKPYHK